MRLSVRTAHKGKVDLRRGFRKNNEGTRTSRKMRCFPYVFMRISPSEMIFNLHATSKRKDNSPPATLLWTLRCQLLYSLGSPRTGFRILAEFPFPQFEYNQMQQATPGIPTFQGGFPRGLGPTHPCCTKLHMETYSASVFRVLNRIIATTTKMH